MKWITAALLASLLTALVGCGSGPQQQVKTSASYLEKVTELRQIFDKYKGDITKLTPEEKKKFVEFEDGNESLVPVYWEHMRNPNAPVGATNKMGGTGQ